MKPLPSKAQPLLALGAVATLTALAQTIDADRTAGQGG